MTRQAASESGGCRTRDVHVAKPAILRIRAQPMTVKQRPRPDIAMRTKCRNETWRYQSTSRDPPSAISNRPLQAGCHRSLGCFLLRQGAVYGCQWRLSTHGAPLLSGVNSDVATFALPQFNADRHMVSQHTGDRYPRTSRMCVGEAASLRAIERGYCGEAMLRKGCSISWTSG